MTCRLATCDRAAVSGELFCASHGKLRIPPSLEPMAEKNRRSFEHVIAIVAQRLPDKLIRRQI